MSRSDPDSEIILATTVTAGNAADGAAVEQLLANDFPAGVSAGLGIPFAPPIRARRWLFRGFRV